MLSQKHRLRKKEDFARVFRFGKPLYSQGMLIMVLDAPVGSPKIGVTFKQKVFERASERHLYKRKMLEALRLVISLVPENKLIVILFQKREVKPNFEYFVKQSQLLIERLK